MIDKKNIGIIEVGDYIKCIDNKPYSVIDINDNAFDIDTMKEIDECNGRIMYYEDINTSKKLQFCAGDYYEGLEYGKVYKVGDIFKMDLGWLMCDYSNNPHYSITDEFEYYELDEIDNGVGFYKGRFELYEKNIVRNRRYKLNKLKKNILL